MRNITSIVAVGVLVVVALAACGNDSPATNPGRPGDPDASVSAADAADAPDPDGCAGLDEAQAFACTERWFWRVFQVDFAGRRDAWTRMQKVESTHAGAQDRKKLARMIFQRGQLGLAMALEDGASDVIFEVQPAFQKAVDLDAEEAFYATWRDSMDVGLAAVQNKREEVMQHLEVAWKNVERKPHTNIPSITGTTIGLPLDTGAPAKSVALLEAWECHPDRNSTNPWCTENSWKAPYLLPGFGLHLGEAYARVGNRARATEFFQRAVSAPGAATWKYRSMVEGYLSDMDGYMKTWSDLGQDRSGVSIAYANSVYACRICHSPSP